MAQLTLVARCRCDLRQNSSGARSRIAAPAVKITHAAVRPTHDNAHLKVHEATQLAQVLASAGSWLQHRLPRQRQVAAGEARMRIMWSMRT